MRLSVKITECESTVRLFAGDNEIENVWIDDLHYDQNISPTQITLRLRLMIPKEVKAKCLLCANNKLLCANNALRQSLRIKRQAEEEGKRYIAGEEG